MTKVEDHYDSPLDNLLFAVQDEREAQIKRFGHQHHPMTYDGAVPMYELREALYKDRWEAQRRAGEITWDTVLLEEAYEALAERVPAKQIEELVQVAAVALAMAEDLMTQEEEA